MFNSVNNSDLSGKFLDISECLSNSSKNDFNQYPSYYYEFDLQKGEGIFTIMDKVMPCCTDSKTFTTLVNTKGNEIETTPIYNITDPCECYCLYNLTSKLTGVKAEKYNIKSDDLDEIIDLSKSTKGIFKFDSITQTYQLYYYITGKIKETSICKNNTEELDSTNNSKGIYKPDRNYYNDSIPAKIEYDFDLKTGKGTITLLDFEANCCSDSIITKTNTTNTNKIDIQNKGIWRSL